MQASALSEKGNWEAGRRTGTKYDLSVTMLFIFVTFFLEESKIALRAS